MSTNPLAGERIAAAELLAEADRLAAEGTETQG